MKRGRRSKSSSARARAARALVSRFMNPSARLRVERADLDLMRRLVKWGKQNKEGIAKKFHPFARASIARAKTLPSGQVVVKLSTQALRQFVAGGGWGIQGLLASAPKGTRLTKAMYALWRSARLKAAADALKTAAQKRAEKKAGTYKAPPPDFWGYRLLHRFSRRGRKSVIRALRHFAARPRFIVKYNSTSGKMGPGVTATYSPRQTCPGTCGFYNDCYANEGNVRSNWIAATLGLTGLPWGKFLKKLAASPNQKVRVNIAGDLPGDGKRIDRRKAFALARAASRNGTRVAWTYTHYPITRENLGIIRGMIRLGLMVNLSADNLADADKKARTGLDVAVVLPAKTPGSVKTPAGRPVVKCPSIMDGMAATRLAEYRRARGEPVRIPVTCSTCVKKGFCARPGRNYIVGFPAHGQRAAKQTDAALLGVARPTTLAAAEAAQRARLAAMGINPPRRARRRWRRRAWWRS